MSLSSLAITRPITIIMIFSSAVLIGLVSLLYLPVELYPNVSFNDVSIVTYIRGGIPPTEVENLVTKPIEEVVSTVTHLKSLLSISKEGESTVVLSFEPGTNMEYAALEVREEFAKVKDKLPREAEKPTIAQFKQEDTPIMIIAATSDRRTTEDLRREVDTFVTEKLKRITGVANVEVAGGRERKILIEVDKYKLYKHRVSLMFLLSKIGSNNLDVLSGDIKETKYKYLIRTKGTFDTVEDIKNLPLINTSAGSVLRVKDVSRVQDSYLDPKGYARMNIRPVVNIYIQKESTANTISVAEEAMAEVERLREVIPRDMRLIVTSNSAKFISSAMTNLKVSLFRGALLIILVLSFFMGHIPKEKKALLGFTALLIAAVFTPLYVLYVLFVVTMGFVIYVKRLRPLLIVTLSIPISVIITFGLMEICNMAFPPSVISFSINFITMVGLALGVGMLVDNSIVVFENILKKTEEGLDKIRAGLEGSTEMNTVIIASTITTVVVFLPMVFVKSEMSYLYSGIAWTITFSLAVSLFVALAMVPLMASRMSISSGDSEYFLKPLYKWQRKILLWIMRRRLFVIAAIIGFFAAAIFLYARLGKEFMGSAEQSTFTIFIELPTGAKLDIVNETTKRVESLLKDIPEVKTFSSRVENWSSKVYVEVVSPDKRKRSVNEVIESLRPKTDRIKPAFIYYEGAGAGGGGGGGGKEILLDIYGFDYDIMRQLAVSIATRLSNIKGFTDTKIRMREGRPELGLKVDKQKAGTYGMTVRGIGDSVHAQMRGMRATQFHEKETGGEVETIARLDEKYRKTFKDLHNLVIIKDDGSRVILDQVADFVYGLGPSEIWRRNRARMIQVTANIGSHPLSKGADLVKNALKDIKFPEGYFYKFGGDYPSLLKNQKEFRFLIIVILALIYMVLASIFESYYQPFIIMATVMFATIGAIFSLFFAKTAVGMGSLLGMMMLAGIVVNNGIILVEQINFLREKKGNLYRILITAPQGRLRPVLMTSVTTVIAMLPMALGKEEGSDLWRPLAITVIGGLMVATPLTLLLTSNIYLMFENTKNFILDRILRRKKRKMKQLSPETPSS